MTVKQASDNYSIFTYLHSVDAQRTEEAFSQLKLSKAELIDLVIERASDELRRELAQEAVDEMNAASEPEYGSNRICERTV